MKSLFNLDCKMKGGAASCLTLNPYRSVHHLYKLLAYRKTKAGAAILSRCRGIDLAERLK